MGSMQLGVPVKLLKECINKKVTVEASNGDVYRGILLDAEENLSVCLSGVKTILVDGKQVEMESVYIKGSRVRLISLPDSITESLSNLTKPARPFRGGKRGGFRGGRGGGPRYDRKGSTSSFDRRRY